MIIARQFGPPAHPHPNLTRSSQMSTDIERELERTTELRGFRYGLHDFVAHVRGVDALKKHNDRSEANYLKKGLLDRKTKELVIVAALVAAKDRVSHIQIHMH